MFYLRAKEGNSDSTIQGARKYYADKSCKRLFEKGLIDDLFKVLNIWKVANQHLVIDGEAWSNNIKTIKTLDILCSYPNEYWKYPVIIYYLSHCSEPDFDHIFSLFLRKLLLELLTKYLVTPTINAVKTDILKLNVEIIPAVHPLTSRLSTNRRSERTWRTRTKTLCVCFLKFLPTKNRMHCS